MMHHENLTDEQLGTELDRLIATVAQRHSDKRFVIVASAATLLLVLGVSVIVQAGVGVLGVGMTLAGLIGSYWCHREVQYTRALTSRRDFTFREIQRRRSL
jgi:hypothetical protein